MIFTPLQCKKIFRTFFKLKILNFFDDWKKKLYKYMFKIFLLKFKNFNYFSKQFLYKITIFFVNKKANPKNFLQF